MARSLRWSIVNGLYHVMNRGIERHDIVHDDVDRQEWMRLLNRVANRCEWRIFAYVLLDNHFHLFLKTPKPNLSAGMHDLQSGYAALFNQRHGRVGHLYQGRFKSVLVENEGHCWELSRYLHLNPVRAKLTGNPGSHEWSSYGYFLNPNGAPVWLDWRSVLNEFGPQESASRVAYKRFVEAGLAVHIANPFSAVVDGWLLGSPAFIGEMRAIPEDVVPSKRSSEFTPDDLIQEIMAMLKISRESIVRKGQQENLPREAAVWLLRELLQLPVNTIGEMLGGVGKSTVSTTFQRASQRRKNDPAFRLLLDQFLAKDKFGAGSHE